MANASGMIRRTVSTMCSPDTDVRMGVAGKSVRSISEASQTWPGRQWAGDVLRRL